MIVPDVNVLVLAYNEGAPSHTAVRECWLKILAGRESIGLPWHSIIGFIRIITKRALIPHAATVTDAIATVQSWLALPHVQIIHPTDRHAEIFFSLLDELGTAGNLTSDAHLAALAIEYHATLATTDVNFRRFPKLRTANPLKP